MKPVSEIKSLAQFRAGRLCASNSVRYPRGIAFAKIDKNNKKFPQTTTLTKRNFKVMTFQARNGLTRYQVLDQVGQWQQHYPTHHPISR